MSNLKLISVNPVPPLSAFASLDGRILTVANGDIGNADTSYAYFDLLKAGFNGFTIQYIIQNTTLTFEGTNDDDSYSDEADELISATVDRDFSGAGNWESDGLGATVAVNAGGLDVRVGDVNTGAKLSRDYFVKQPDGSRGFVTGKRYTILVSISGLTSGTVSIYAGTQLVASGLSDGAAQSFVIFARSAGEKLSIVGTAASAEFTLDDISIKHVVAEWTDITDIVADDPAVTSVTSSGMAAMMNSFGVNRLRIKRVTTNATNALKLILSRSHL